MLGLLCCLSEARPHEKKHGTLYSDPGYIGYWRPPAVNKIYYPEKETHSAETKGEKSIGSKQPDSLNSGKVEDAVAHTTTGRAAEKSTSTASPKHKTEAQHKSVTAAPEHLAQERHNSSLTEAPQHQSKDHQIDTSKVVEGTQSKEKTSAETKEIVSKSKITSVKLTIQDEGSSSKWNDQMTEVIREVYGGKLPYSENEMVLNDLSGKNEEIADKTNEGQELAPSRVKHSPDLNEKIPEKSTQKSTTMIMNDNLGTKKEEDSMQKVIRKIQETKVDQTTTTTKPKHEPSTLTTQEHQDQKVKESKVKVSSTTAAPSTRPNPPTTRPTRVTPVSERKTEPKHVPSKSHAQCKSDLDCRAGRVCQAGSCVCGDDSLCAKHTHPVCGSDGVVYPSHCELHRQACLHHKHIKVDSEGTACANQKGDPQTTVSTKNNTVIRDDRKCSYEQIRVNSDNVFMMCDVAVSFKPDIVGCQAACEDCKAFTYLQGACQVYHDEVCVNMLNELGKNHYIKHCHNTGPNSSCHILEVTPGKSPYMCSKATSSLSTLLDCHDTCLRGHCEAFKFLKDSFCEIYFDKSCLEMLKKGWENYYVKRCANPKDCSYHEVQLPASVPCEIRSDKMSSFEDCRDACEDCTAIKYDYSTGECHTYHQVSCITQKSVNFIKRDCGQSQDIISTKEPLLLRVKRPDSTDKPGKPLTLDKDKSEIVLQSEKPESQTEKAPEIKVSLERINLGPSSSSQGEGQANDLSPKKLRDRVEEAMFSELCSLQEYTQMKAEVLRYHCVRFQEKDCSPKALYSKKDYLASLMFSYYDKNMDNTIVRDEIWEIWVTEPFQRMFASCTLMDMFRFENILDDEIQEGEFLKAFDLEPAAFEESFQEVPTLATVGNGLELRCGISPSSENSHIIWSRHHTDLETISFPGIAVFSDGTLYFESVGVHHIGNWTCYDKYRSGFKQVHILQINIPPMVKVSPSSMMLPVSGVDIYLHCHVTGIPRPTVQWQFNDKVIPVRPDHYARIHENGTLIIKSSNYQRDSGAYKCLAKNVAGNNEDIAMVYIQKPNQTENHLYSKQSARQETFFVFHQTGYSAYNPSGCYTKRQVHSSFGHLKYIPEELDAPIHLCDQRKDCNWGPSVNVQNKFIYITQPTENRVVVIDAAQTMNPVEFIKTDLFPAKLYYVEHLDEVWVLCWNTDKGTGSKTIVVIKEASYDTRHSMVHTQPIGYKFDMVKDMFIPPTSELHQNMRYGYVVHSEQHNLFKMELESMRYTKSLDLESFACLPQEVAFIPLGGHILVQCKQTTGPNGPETTQILIDLITDTPVANITLPGTPYVSPDSKHVVSVDKETGRIHIAQVKESGEITKMTEVTVSSKVSDVTFFPSKDGHGYSIVMTSQELPEIYSVQLNDGKITSLKGMGEPRKKTLNPFTTVSREVVGGDVFSKYFATPSKDALLILNGQDMYIDCQLSGLKNPDKVAYNVASVA